jgi:hypothetical protein
MRAFSQFEFTDLSRRKEGPSIREEPITKPRSEAEMETAYRQPLERVRQLARREDGAAPRRLIAHPGAEDIRRLHDWSPHCQSHYGLTEGRIVGNPMAAFKSGSLLIASITFLAI